MEKVAILVDGAFYRRRAYRLFGDKDPQERADELVSYCKRHLESQDEFQMSSLYRILYYDCPPMTGNVYRPLLEKPICMEKSETFLWSNEFYDALANKRKVALRMGELQEGESCFRLKSKAAKNCFVEISPLKTSRNLILNLMLFKRASTCALGST